MNIKLLSLILLFLSVQTKAQDPFNLPLPDGSDLEISLNLWATTYNLYEVEAVSHGDAIRSINGQKLGPDLSRRDWCRASMEGSIKVAGVTYNYDGVSSSHRVNCKKYWSYDTSKTKFKVARGRYGDGVSKYILVPFRTIAVDPKKIRYGTVLFIPSAVGVKIRLPGGEELIHDGYFFAGDTGGAIKKFHVDLFIGPTNNPANDNPFDFAKSNPKYRFRAFIISNDSINNYLESIHLNFLNKEKI